MIAVVFDMDGVIFDTEQLCLRCWRALAESFGVKDVEPMFRKCVGTNVNKTREIVLEAQGDDFPFEEYRVRTSELFHKIEEEEGIPQKPGVKELLIWLKERKIPVGLASSTRRAAVEKELKDAGLFSYFDVIVGGDMVNQSKPHPEIYLRACRELRIDPKEVFAVEDSYNGIRSAFAAGMHPIMVPDLLPPDKEMEQKAERIFDSLLEVKTFFESQVWEKQCKKC
ncbi:MAG: HAD family phosphatase [Fusicatenibacter sp.]|nr:HAD family phosphatase [Lachnospiraceae bacterium]MDY2937076.1 HAD family phosphatase [Fusicatenibacter sp.]